MNRTICYSLGPQNLMCKKLCLVQVKVTSIHNLANLSFVEKVLIR